MEIFIIHSITTLPLKQSNKMTKIKFGKIEDFRKDSNSYVGLIPLGITHKQDLLKSYAEVFKFPDYFGFNWDALDECLADFDWLNGIKHIVIYHLDLSQIGIKETKTFLNVLNHNAGAGLGGSLTVAFPEQYREEIETILASSCLIESRS